MPPPDSPAAFDPDLPPSSSLLFYLFADRVAPAARRGTRALLADVRVDTERLAGALFGVAFWQLREAGLIRLEPVNQGQFVRTGTQLRVVRTSGVESGRRDGIEAGLLDVLTPGSLGKLTPGWEALPGWVRQVAGWSEGARAQLARLPNLPPVGEHARAEPPETISAAVMRWYGSDVLHPARVPIAWTEREGVAKGYVAIVEAHRNPIAALFMGKTEPVAVRERVAALEPTFTRLLARWQAFRSGEAELAVQLEQEIIAGIRERSDTSGSGS